MLLKNVLAYKILAYRKDTKNLWGPPARTLGSSETKDLRPLTGQAGAGIPALAARAPRGRRAEAGPAEALARRCQLRRKFLSGPGGNLRILAAFTAAVVGSACPSRCQAC